MTSWLTTFGLARSSKRCDVDCSTAMSLRRRLRSWRVGSSATANVFCRRLPMVTVGGFVDERQGTNSLHDAVRVRGRSCPFDSCQKQNHHRCPGIRLSVTDLHIMAVDRVRPRRLSPVNQPRLPLL